MTARYVLNTTPYALGQHFGIPVTDNFPPRHNIAPSQPIPIIRQDLRGERELALVRWGFVPGWDRKGEFFKRAMVNIRVESAAEKPSFRNAWRRRHCLLPMNGYYDWLEEGGVKQPYYVTMAEDMPLFCVAGLWEHWLGEDGSEMETAAFLTRNDVWPLTGEIDRMPIFIPPERYEDWLHADELDMRVAEEALKLPQPKLEHWPVSRRVNSWKPDDPSLIEPHREEKQGTLL
ncbi:MAG: SOS response-associated peptidase [Pseudomonadota bacterium]